MTRKQLYLALGGFVGVLILIFTFKNNLATPSGNTLVDNDNLERLPSSRNGSLDIQDKKSLDKIRDRKLAKIAQERTEAQREAGILGKKNAPNHLLIGDDGKITQQALRESGISTIEAKRIQTIFDEEWKKVSLELAKHARLDSEASDLDNEIYAYKIPALPDGGAANVSEIEKRVKEVVGSSIGSQLIDAFDPNQYLCGFGKYDVEVVFYPTSQDGRNMVSTAEYSFTYPKSSQVVSRGEVTSEKFYKLFGFVVNDLADRDQKVALL